MTGKRILLEALRGNATSRPAWVPFVGVHGGKMIGVSARRYLQSADCIVRGLMLARERYRADGLPVVFDLQFEAEVLGCQMLWGDNTPPSVVSHPLETCELGDLPTFDTSKGRYPIVAEAMAKLTREFEDETALYGLITGPFTLAVHLGGTNLFLQMYEEPDKVKAILSFCAEVGRRTAEFYIDNGADVIAVVDPMTSQISPAHFEEFVSQYADRILAHVRQQGALSSFFVCGNATRNLEKMCQTQADNLSVDENISLEYLAELAGKYNKSFGGNLKLTTVLLLGNEMDAMRDALRCMDLGGTQGFVLAPGCDLPYATPEANLEAVGRVLHDEYQRSIVRAAASMPQEEFKDVKLPDYGKSDHVIIDVVTLDSASCAPCQYMVDAVVHAAVKFGDKVIINEHKITTRDGLGAMSKLGVGQIPTICIDGEVTFPSIIPDINTLIEAIGRRIREKL